MELIALLPYTMTDCASLSLGSAAGFSAILNANGDDFFRQASNSVAKKKDDGPAYQLTESKWNSDANQVIHMLIHNPVGPARID